MLINEFQLWIKRPTRYNIDRLHYLTQFGSEDNLHLKKQQEFKYCWGLPEDETVSCIDTSPRHIITSADPTGAVNPEYSHIMNL